MQTPEPNELVLRLTKKNNIECSRPDKTPKSLKECIDRNYVHVMFKETGTEIGIRLARDLCKMENVDFDEESGSVILVGGLILNYNKVKCVAEIEIKNCEGVGYLELLSDDQYDQLMKNANH